jgi:hypothetical protein
LNIVYSRKLTGFLLLTEECQVGLQALDLR